MACGKALGLLDRAKQRIGQIADAIFRYAGDIDATVTNHIDAVLGF
jgi:hypothetical protein